MKDTEIDRVLRLVKYRELTRDIEADRAARYDKSINDIKMIREVKSCQETSF